MLFPLPEIPSCFPQLTSTHGSDFSLNLTFSRVPSLTSAFRSVVCYSASVQISYKSVSSEGVDIVLS